jgi:hypothetical protein
MFKESHRFKGTGLPPGLPANAGTSPIDGSPAIAVSLNVGFDQLIARV